MTLLTFLTVDYVIQASLKFNFMPNKYICSVLRIWKQIRNYVYKYVLPPFYEKTRTPKNPAISRVFAKEIKKGYKSKKLVLYITPKFSFT